MLAILRSFIGESAESSCPDGCESVEEDIIIQAEPTKSITLIAYSNSSHQCPMTFRPGDTAASEGVEKPPRELDSLVRTISTGNLQLHDATISGAESDRIERASTASTKEDDCNWIPNSYSSRNGSSTPCSASSMDSHDTVGGHTMHTLSLSNNPGFFAPYEPGNILYITESTWTHEGRDLLEDFSLALSNLGDAATLSRSEAKRLRRLARKNSSVLIGYLVALFRRDGVIMGLAVVTAMRKSTFTRRTHYRLSSPDYPDCWVRLKKSARKSGVDFTPVRQIFFTRPDSLNKLMASIATAGPSQTEYEHGHSPHSAGSHGNRHGVAVHDNARGDGCEGGRCGDPARVS